MKRFKLQKTYFALVMLILGVCVLLIAGCGGGEEIAAALNPDVDTVAPGEATCLVAGPRVTSSDPTDGAIDILTDAKITANFGERMDGGSINAQRFKLSETETGSSVTASAVTYTYNLLGLLNYAEFTPQNPLKYSTEYTADVSYLVETYEGIQLSCRYRWSFTTETLAD